MEEERKRILWIGDFVVPTGFATVNHNIVDRLKDIYDIWVLGVNYWGNPNIQNGKQVVDENVVVFPAFTPGGDVHGYAKLPVMLSTYAFDAIFILNDIWVVERYLKIIKETIAQLERDMPKIVVYYPVDGGGYDTRWFENFDIVSKAVVYTEFGFEVTNEVMPELDLEIIPHGASDTRSIFRVDKNKLELRKMLFPESPNSWGGFWVLNANRNQNRKRLDTSLKAFALFAKDKEDVFYYHHAGLKDAGWDFIGLAKRLEQEVGTSLISRIILTNKSAGKQTVSIEHLNLIYNICDVGINTGLGEGWGLTQTEHASIGAPQVVGDHSALGEIFKDIGVLLPVVTVLRDQEWNTKRYVVDAQDGADALELLYQDVDYYNELSRKSAEKFRAPYYQWDNIAKTWEKIFERVLSE